MKVIVTGGAGFIGSNLTEGLIEKGHEVVVIDNFNLGVEENLKGLDHTFYKLDISNARDLEDVFAKERPDIVFNEAAHSSAPMFDRDPRRGYEVNVLGFANVLFLSQRYDVKRVVYASSSSVYGLNPCPQSENQKVIPPNFYSATKLENENFARIFTQKTGLETVGFRYFSVYGPRERAKGRFANTLSQFLWDLKKDIPPVIYGDGKQTRDFVNVKDVVRANILAIKNGVPGEVYNLGTGESASFNRVIEIENDLLGKDIKAKFVKNPIHNYVMDTLADISKAEKELKFKSRISLEDGIGMSVDYY
jgi:UDP-glucose 4-epimerase